MFNNKKILAIIPARSGSKGLVNKNIKNLNGKPLIAYTIEAAKKSNIFDQIIVTTDSEKYATISRQYGAEVPFLRPSKLSLDNTSSMDVILHVLDELKKQELDKNTIVLLWSDHGWHLGEHGIFGKMTNFNIATNSPLIIKVPGYTKDGKVANALVETIDIYPTLADLCGIEYPNDLDGESLVPILENTETKGKPYARSFYYRNKALGKTLKTENYRIVRWASVNDSTVAVGLYDHRNDPGENINIALKNKALTDSLLIQLEAAKFLSADMPFVKGWE